MDLLVKNLVGMNIFEFCDFLKDHTIVIPLSYKKQDERIFYIIILILFCPYSTRDILLIYVSFTRFYSPRQKLQYINNWLFIHK